MENISIPLVNQTGLDSKTHSIYVLGFSATSKKELIVDSTTKKASFKKISSTKGSLSTYKLGIDITSIEIDATTTPLKKIDGARIYFFIAENTTFPNAPIVKYTNSGAQIINVPNPPNKTIPPYTFTEFTLVDTGYGAVIDSQTVDGFVFPLTITLNDNLGAIGQPLTLDRPSILKSYAPFLSSIKDDTIAFEDLQYTKNKGGLLNPGAYLGEISDIGEFLNLKSSLNTLFDIDLNSLFTNNNLSIQGVSQGNISTDIYVSSSGEKTLPNSTFTHSALTFTGVSNNLKFDIFNPVNLCVLTYTKDNKLAPIIGTILNTILTFKDALPTNTPLLKGMYIQGAGVPSGVTIKEITTNATKEIVSITLSENLANPAPNSQYLFSKVSNLFLTSGNMVFANQGVFAYTDGETNTDLKTVILNLQNQIVSALNRGVANSSPTSGTPGYSTKYWGEQNNWYPENKAQNLFSLFMHTAADNGTPVFLQASDSVNCARGTKMGQAYGFAYDENPGIVAGTAPKPQPEVPSKYDPLPNTTTSATITLGPWILDCTTA